MSTGRDAWAITITADPVPLTEDFFMEAMRSMMKPRPYVPHVHIVSPRCCQCCRMWGDVPDDVIASYEAALDRVFGP